MVWSWYVLCVLGRLVLYGIGDWLLKLWLRHVFSRRIHSLHALSSRIVWLRLWLLLYLLVGVLLNWRPTLLQQLSSRHVFQQWRVILRLCACWLLHAWVGIRLLLVLRLLAGCVGRRCEL